MPHAETIINQPVLIYGDPVAFQPFVSIAIPTYRRSELLREAIASALSQGEYLPYEVIVVDNDPSQKILDVVQAFAPSRIAVYQNSVNVGMWGNMNHALNLATGEWIVILPDDDLLMPDALQAFERIISSSKERNIGCLAGGIQLLLSEHRRPLIDTRVSRIRFPIAGELYSAEDAVRITCDMTLADVPKYCASFYRREYVKDVGGWDPACCGYADVALLLKIQQENRLYTCMEVFGCFRVHDDNDSHPGKLWRSYPIDAARRLLTCYVDETTALGRGLRHVVERSYVSALWKNRYTSAERTFYADQLLQGLEIRNSTCRYLLSNVRLLNWLGWVYSALRPCLGRGFRFLFDLARRLRKCFGRKRNSATANDGDHHLPDCLARHDDLFP